MDADIVLDCDLRAFEKMKLDEHILLHHEDVKAMNTEENPNTVVPVVVKSEELDGGRTSFRLPSLSWNVFRFSPEESTM